MMLNRFFPRYAEINDITNAKQAVATFDDNHDFTDGEYVSFRVGKDFGMHEINEKRGLILSHTDDTITTDIDSTTWNAFDIASLNNPGTSPPVCVPCCSGVIPFSNPRTVNLEDSFDNRRV